MKAKDLVRLLERDMKEYGDDAVVKVAEHQKYAHDILYFHFDGRDETVKLYLVQ